MWVLGGPPPLSSDSLLMSCCGVFMKLHSPFEGPIEVSPTSATTLHLVKAVGPSLRPKMHRKFS